MRTVFFIEKEDFSKAKNMIYADETVSRQTINFREARAMGFEKNGYYLDIEGSEESIKKAKEVLGELCKEVDDKEKGKILKKAREQEDSAAAGFGNIFG